MTIKPIKSKKDYQAALARLEQIFDAKSGSKDGDELEILGILIEKYEQTHYPIDYPDPIEAIKFRMEQLGYTQNDLTPFNQKSDCPNDNTKSIIIKRGLSSPIIF